MPLPAPVMMATLPSNKVDEAALPPPARCLFTTAILLPCDIVVGLSSSSSSSPSLAVEKVSVPSRLTTTIFWAKISERDFSKNSYFRSHRVGFPSLRREEGGRAQGAGGTEGVCQGSPRALPRVLASLLPLGFSYPFFSQTCRIKRPKGGERNQRHKRRLTRARERRPKTESVASLPERRGERKRARRGEATAKPKGKKGARQKKVRKVLRDEDFCFADGHF